MPIHTESNNETGNCLRQAIARRPRFVVGGWMAGMGVFVLTFAFLAVRAPGFLTPVNLVRNLVMPAGIAGVVALGMTVVMAGGGIDLSVGSTAGLAALVAATLATRVDLGLPFMLFAAIIAGLLIGTVNGAFVAYLGVNPFVVTLSSVFLIRGLQFLVTLSAVSGTYLMLPVAMTRAGSSATFQIGLFLIIVVGLYIFLDRTRPGRYIRAVGESLEVARFSGIPVRFYTWLTYVICSGLVAVGGVMLTSYEGMARVGTGDGYLIDAFVLPILGQAVFRRVSVEGTVFGALFMYMVINGLFIFGTPPVYVNIIKGGLLLAVILVSGLQKLRES